MKRSACILLACVFVAPLLVCGCAGDDEAGLSTSDLKGAEKVIGLEFTGEERDSMIGDLRDNLEAYVRIRGLNIGNGVSPAFRFDPVPAGFEPGADESGMKLGPSRPVTRPEDPEELAFMSIRQLASLVRSREVTSTELTSMYLERLKRLGPGLECVITLTEELALKQAARADREIAAGRYRGLLHGIPYGAKDLLSVKGYGTTWGAEPYRDQIIDRNAAVIDRLEEEGAVLVAKLTLGALAWGDVWYGGKTRNPWNTKQGSSGSSAGSAAATAAGLVAFALGTETWGSIVSPCTRCGVTGLRPTFGRVSRDGAMALSWTMDKIGPICRSAEDCAIVFDAIRGPGGGDRTVVDFPFDYRAGLDLKTLRIGYLKELFEEDYNNRDNDLATLDKLRELGARLIPVKLPDYPVRSMSFILSAEAAAAFDRLTRTGRDDLMVRQGRNAWPNVFRASRFIPAVEYIQANRLRHMVMNEMEEMEVDMYVAPSFGGDNLLLTNLTGHPCVVMPNGVDGEGGRGSISLIGKLFGERKILAVAKAYQDATPFDDEHPPGFE